MKSIASSRRARVYASLPLLVIAVLWPAVRTILTEPASACNKLPTRPKAARRPQWRASGRAVRSVTAIVVPRNAVVAGGFRARASLREPAAVRRFGVAVGHHDAL